MQRLRWAVLGVAVVGVMGLAACTKSTDATPDAFANDKPAGNLYNEGLAYMNAGKLKDATKSFDEVDRQHPYSEYARKALIMSTFTSYKRGDFTTAISSGNRYLALYPGSPDAAYATYLIGLSYFRRMPDVTRDQSMTRKALAAFEEIVNNYPTSEYVTDAKDKIYACRDQLAGKDMQVGRYYLEQRNYLAAINRFKIVVTQYPKTRQIDEALERLTEAYMALGLTNEAQTATAVLGHNFPDSPWYKDAYKLIKSGGLEPRENTGSWISKVFAGKNTS